MKKFVAAILAVLYISTSFGATIYTHYCMGKLAGWGLDYNISKTCGKCGMKKTYEKDNGCCKDEHKFVKSDTDQLIAEAGFQLNQLISETLPVSFIAIPLHDFLTLTEENPISHAPPRSCGLAEYIRNCVFRI